MKFEAETKHAPARIVARYKAYVNRYPDGCYVEAAKRRIELLRIIGNTSLTYDDPTKPISICQSYISSYPEGYYVENAKERMAYFKVLSIENESKKDVYRIFEACQSYLAKYPMGNKAIHIVDRRNKICIRPYTISH